MTLDEFSNIYSKQPSTVKKNMERIPGIEYVNREYIVIEGTRYFYTVRSHINNNFDRIYEILKALNKNQYVDSKMLRCSEEDFNYLLKQLQERNLIEQNHCQNQYGANGYNITISGMEYANMEKTKALKTFTEITGTFVGAVISQMKK